MAVTYSQNGVIVRSAGINVIGGKSYKTAQMPDGKIWLAENLDFKFCNIGGSGTSSIANAWYYNNDESTYGWNGYKCGLLYNWYAVELLNDNRADLCPGWHVPSDSEWDALATACGGASVAGTKLKALDNSVASGFPSGWNGNDDYGFSALPASFRESSTFHQFGSDSVFWTPEERNSGDGWQHFLTTGSELGDSYTGKFLAASIRLVRDT